MIYNILEALTWKQFQKLTLIVVKWNKTNLINTLKVTRFKMMVYTWLQLNKEHIILDCMHVNLRSLHWTSFDCNRTALFACAAVSTPAPLRSPPAQVPTDTGRHPVELPQQLLAGQNLYTHTHTKPYLMLEMMSLIPRPQYSLRSATEWEHW